MTETLTQAWRFNQGGMAGYISGGEEHGVEITWGADKKNVTRRMCMNLEHYFASGKLGLFVPRLKMNARAELISEDSVRVRIDPREDWRVRSSITYRLLPERCIQAEYVFAFEEAYQGFHALISNYFHEPTEPFLHLDGRWIQPSLGAKEHRNWPRDMKARRLLNATMKMLEGHPEVPADQARPVDDLCYDHPIMVSPIRDTGWSVTHIVERNACISLSANRRWNAHDFSLVGRDVAAGDSVVCRAWMIYARLESLDAALDIADRLTGSIKSDAPADTDTPRR